MARFLLKRVAEEFGIVITIDPKPIKGDWNGTGLHTNVSTKEMREDGGMKAIEAMMSKLEKRNMEHIEVYGEGNRDRMTGEHETANIDQFTWGVANRGASVRVPRQCAAAGKGYFEDRRPASNADPYQITGIMMETVSVILMPLLVTEQKICSVRANITETHADKTTPDVRRRGRRDLRPGQEGGGQVVVVEEEELHDKACYDLVGVG